MRVFAFAAAMACLSIANPAAAAVGAYASVPAADGAECVKLCDADTLCVGWTFGNSACGLWASAPNPTPDSFTLSTHAPAFAQRRTPTQVAEAPTPQPASPARHQTASETLLGGEDVGADLRPRLGDGG